MIKRNIYVMYAIALLQGMVFYAPIATLYRTAQGLSIFEITMIESISLVLCFLFEIPWGMIADRIGYKKTILLCNGLYWLSKIIFWQASDFGGFLAERILLAVVISGLSGVDVSILYMSCDKGNSQQVFGIYNALQTTGLLAASCVCSVYVGTQYQSAGFFTVISYGAAMILSFCLWKESEQSKRRNQIFLRC